MDTVGSDLSADCTGSYINGGDFDSQGFGEGKRFWRESCGQLAANSVEGEAAGWWVQRQPSESARPGLEDQLCRWRMCDLPNRSASLWSPVSLLKNGDDKSIS